MKINERSAFVRGISTIGVMPDRSRFLRDYMRGNSYLDMLKDWQCVGSDMRTSMEIARMRYGKG